VTVVSTSDYFGPDAVENVFLGKTFTKRICQGQSPFAIGSAAVVHDFCFLPDLAKSLHVVSKHDKAYDNFWICPHSIKGKTLAELAADMDKTVRSESTPELDDEDYQEEHGEKEEKPESPPFNGVTVMPALMIRTLRPFNAYLREILDRIHCWRQDYRVDDSAIRAAFDLEATPYEEALQEYVAMYLYLIENQQQRSIE
jgi:nucleoside-diphosphate-sugar epimerase